MTATHEEVLAWSMRTNCHYCGSNAGEVCRTVSGKILKVPHSCRIHAARVDLNEPYRLERQARKYKALAVAAVRMWQHTRSYDQVASVLRDVDQGKLKRGS